MILKYGSYAHPLHEASLVVRREPLLNAARLPYAVLERWEVDGLLHADSQVELTTAIRALVAAYAVPGGDAVLYLDDGATPTAHRLMSRDTLGGVRIVAGPSFPDGRGAEYSTFRSYHLVLEAELPLMKPATLILAWDETLSFSGGGPRWVLLQTLSGQPVRQQIAESTACRVTQSGRAVGYNAYPALPTPIWPQAEHQDRRRISRKAPRRVGAGASQDYKEFEVTWVYEFEAAAPLAGEPTAWVG